MKKGDILYKVVHKEYRYGSNMSIYMYKNKNIKINVLLEDIKRKFGKDFDLYFPKYIKGKILETNKRGFMCYSSLEDADQSLYIHKFSLSDCITIRIRALSTPIKYDHVITGCGTNPTKLLTERPDIWLYEDVFAVKKLEVLD